MLMHSTVNYDSLALDFMPVVRKSIMRVIADVAAVEAGLSLSDVSNVKYEGREASCFEISTGTSKELHVFVHESAKLAYIIATILNNRQESATFDRVYDIQMPQNPKGGWGGDGAISSSKKK
ncbi:hypothetical protein F2Q68_00012928 [Brassica cretica]|uniref:Uncharacterized protein n=1 Tax=Brassica cretica TaxID=69181 RepID=A0A8S9HE49_BRACR|nr:hypothetical protein F2Q68_00012928 [Brassica cretica]